jgi:hypothetical protein
MLDDVEGGVSSRAALQSLVVAVGIRPAGNKKLTADAFRVSQV